MRILLLNDGYFLDSLRRHGHRVFFASPDPRADLNAGGEPIHLREILGKCPFSPDLCLWSDAINCRGAYLGLEEAEFPLVFYGVDSPMNGFWQADFAAAFDLVFLDQEAPVQALRAALPERRDHIHWLPLGADTGMYRKLPLDKVYDIAFVGSLNARLRPKRGWILEELKRRFRVDVFDGGNARRLPPEEVARIYNQSRLVLNENLFPGANLRLFEAMACGSCLLTEEGDGSWKRFFRDMRHLAAFDADTLVPRAQMLLCDDERREKIAAAGMDLIRRRHSIDRRVRVVLQAAFRLVRQPEGGRPARRRYYLGKAYLALASRWQDQPVGLLAPEGVRLLCHEAAAGRESADLHVELAAQALQDGRHRHAEASLRRALQLDPHCQRAHWALFWCLRDSGDHSGAARQMRIFSAMMEASAPEDDFQERIITGAEFTADDFEWMGELLVRAGWSFEPGVDRTRNHPCRWNAVDAFQQALSRSANDPSNRVTERVYVRCADLMQSAGCLDFAALFMEKAVELKPTDTERRYQLIGWLMRTYRRRQALQHILQCLFLSMEANKWDRLEPFHLTDDEWAYLLDAVLDYSRQSEGALAAASIYCDYTTETHSATQAP